MSDFGFEIGPLKMFLTGGKEMIERVKDIRIELTDETLPKAMRIEAEIEATECKRRCPVDMRREAPHPGLLRNSIHVVGPIKEDKNIKVIIATGAEAPYGLYVHEDLEAHHQVGEAKFIEGPLRESRPYMAARIAARMKQLKKK